MNQSKEMMNRIKGFDQFMSLTLIVLCLPLILLNAFIGLIEYKKVTQTLSMTDALGRSFTVTVFMSGYFCKLAMLFDVLAGRISFTGVSYHLPSDIKSRQLNTEDIWLLAGIYSIHELHKKTGLVEMSHLDSIEYHQQQVSLKFHIVLLIKSCLSQLVYGQHKYFSPKNFFVFGLKVENTTMDDSLDWILTAHAHCETGVFVNVNSVNLSYENSNLKNHINRADHVMADGSGMRLAAKSLHIQLKDNVNGTDMLPLLCKRMVKKDQSLYLVGGHEGVAKQCALNLRQQFPGIRIVGIQNGFFKDSNAIVNDINASGANIVLLGMGSPHQEQWLFDHKHRLNCDTALAVGGLFDFYSGDIARAPRWLRELGMEWLYRLMKEPKAKFKRYVLGNPLFIWRLSTHKKVMGIRIE